jgi:hypothetical protein
LLMRNGMRCCVGLVRLARRQRAGTRRLGSRGDGAAEGFD